MHQQRRVLQGYLGKFSHYQGSGSEYAIDWSMPVGSTVVAAYAGTVVAIRQDSHVGGTDEKFKDSSNYVILRHGDGTFGEYCHLKADSVMVKLGQQVKLRQPLALSGNTGHTTEPHLHFAVFSNIDGNRRKTYPVQFHTKDGSIVTLKEGHSY